MNKKLVTLAVAAAMAAPAAALADATMYGKLHISIDNVSIDELSNWNTPNGHSGLNNLGGAVATYNNILMNGYTDMAGVVVTTGIPEYTTAFTAARDAALAAGEPGQRANVIGMQAGVAAAEAAGTADQLSVAANQAVMAASGYGYSGWDITSQPGASRFGIKGSEDLGNGLKAIYQVELGIDPPGTWGRNNNNGSLSTTLRNSFVGLAGSWGTFLMGRHDTPLKISTGKLDMFADTLADYNLTVGFHDVRASNAAAYISPSFSGFQLAGAVVAPGTAGAYADLYNPAFVRQDYADGLAEAWSIAGIYKNGPFYASAAYEKFNSSIFAARNTGYQTFYGETADDDSKWRLGLGLLDWNGFTLSGVYESRTGVNGAPQNSDLQLWQIQAAYAFGNNTVKGMYGQADVEKCADPYNVGFALACNRGLGLADNQDKATWAIGFDHNLSKRTRAYALYTALQDDIDNADWSGFSMGLIHKF